MMVYVVRSGEPYDCGLLRCVFDNIDAAIAFCEGERLGNSNSLDWTRSSTKVDCIRWRWEDVSPWNAWRTCTLWGAGRVRNCGSQWWSISAVEMRCSTEHFFSLSDRGAKTFVDLILNPPPAGDRLRELFHGRTTDDKDRTGRNYS
jgi:hypothetical protein